MYSKSDNIEIMINDDADEIIEEFFKSSLNRYKSNLEKLTKGSECVFDYFHLLYYKCHKINASYGGSYTNYPNWKKGLQ